MKKIILMGLLLAFLLSIIFSYIEINKDPIINISESKNILQKKEIFPIPINDKCPEGYFTEKRWLSIPPQNDSYITYCQINKTFDQLEKCSSQSDCNESYTCTTEDIEPERDYRCVPLENWQRIDCYCKPDGGCACA